MRWKTAYIFQQTSRGRKNVISLCIDFFPFPAPLERYVIYWAVNEVFLNIWVTDRRAHPFFVCMRLHTRWGQFLFLCIRETHTMERELPFHSERLKIKVIGSSWAPLFVWKGRWRNLHRKPYSGQPRATGKVPFDFISGIGCYISALCTFKSTCCLKAHPSLEKRNCSSCKFQFHFAFHLTKAALVASQFE